MFSVPGGQAYACLPGHWKCQWMQLLRNPQPQP